MHSQITGSHPRMMDASMQFLLQFLTVGSRVCSVPHSEIYVYKILSIFQVNFVMLPAIVIK